MQKPVQRVRNSCSRAWEWLIDLVAPTSDSDGVERVLSKPEVFRKKLGISKITNRSLQRKIADASVRILDAGGAGTFVIGVLAALGVPLAGWVIAVGFVAAAGHFEINRYLRSGENDNSGPLDPFAYALFDFMAPLGLRVAALDGAVTESERECIENYFACEWGYSRKFVRKELSNLERNVEIVPIIKVVDDLAEFKKRNRDSTTKRCPKS